VENRVADSFYSPPLPKNCIYYGVVERFMNSSTQIVVLERDGCIRPYNHFGEIYNVGYPKMLFAYAIKNSRVISTMVVAVKDEFVKNDSAVYHFPYGNVYGDGRVCWGNFSYPSVNSIIDLNFYPEAFYLLEHTHPKNAVGQVIIDLLESSRDKHFDDDKLVLMSTFGKIISTFSK
jgi:hypothetical protein